jgi:hypothetical protein
MTPTPRWIRLTGAVAAGGFAAWSFWVALFLPLDSWDAYDYLVNARLIAGHDLTHLAQTYRTDRPPGISLLVAPLLALGYQPGQRGLAGLVHLVPWSLGLGALALTWHLVRQRSGEALAFLAAAFVALNAIVLHALPFIMADVASMAFGLASLWLAEQVVTRRDWRLVAALALSVGLAMACKYPMGLLGLAVPVANLAWAWTGRDRPATVKEKLLTSVHGRLALGLVAGLALFFAVHALIYSRIVPGPGAWSERMLAGLKTAWAGGGGPGNTDPWWELPHAIWWTFGPPVSLLAVLGAGVVVVRDRDRAGWLHVVWALSMMGLFIFVIGHKESRYVMPALPSIAILAARGLALFEARPKVLAGLAAVALAGLAPSAFAELRRMSDPLYTRPSMLAWARYALDHAGERPIIQHPNISPFALYPKDPVVFPNDEYWHYHHINHGGLEWFFDRRLLAFQVQPGPPGVTVQSPWIHARVPPEWLQQLGDDAVWLAALPKGGILLSPPQGWFETASAAQQPEPPPPFVALDLGRVTLTRRAASETSAEYSDGATTLTLTRQADGWRLTNAPPESRWYIGVADGAPRRWTEPAPDLPNALDGLWSTRHVFPVRP